MLSSILCKLNQASEAILASSVLTKDGLALASALSTAPPSGLDEDTLSAMSSALVALGHKASEDLVGGPFDRVLIEGKAGSLIMTPAGPEAILTVVFTSEAEAGAVFLCMQRASGEIAALVSNRALQ